MSDTDTPTPETPVDTNTVPTPNATVSETNAPAAEPVSSLETQAENPIAPAVTTPDGESPNLPTPMEPESSQSSLPNGQDAIGEEATQAHKDDLEIIEAYVKAFIGRLEKDVDLVGKGIHAEVDKLKSFFFNEAQKIKKAL